MRRGGRASVGCREEFDIVRVELDADAPPPLANGTISPSMWRRAPLARDVLYVASTLVVADSVSYGSAVCEVNMARTIVITGARPGNGWCRLTGAQGQRDRRSRPDRALASRRPHESRQ